MFDIEHFPFSAITCTRAGRFTLTRSGLAIDGEPTREEWSAYGQKLGEVGKSVMWAIGDWLRHGEARWGEMYKEAEVVTGLEYKTLAIAKRIAGVYQFDMRISNLPFYTQQCAASLPVEERSQLLERAEREDLSGREVLMLVKQARNAAAIGAPVASEECCTVDDLATLVTRGKKFGTTSSETLISAGVSVPIAAPGQEGQPCGR